MAEYYPLLAKAIGSLPNSTPDSRRVVYERARKALIGQLRTLHPPVPDEDIDHESVELDRAVERLEAEIANGVVPAAPPSPPPAVAPAGPMAPPAPPAETKGPTVTAGAPAPALRSRPPLPERKPLPPRLPAAPAVSKPSVPAAASKVTPPAPEGTPPPTVTQVGEAVVAPVPEPIQLGSKTDAPPSGPAGSDDARRLKPPQRPIAPQSSGTSAPKRRLWIIPVVVAIVVAVVAAAAWKLRDRPTALARKPTEQTQTDSGKIAERVGEPASQTSPSDAKDEPATPSSANQSSTGAPAQTRSPANPELPIARRAALLVEAPDEASKVKTFVGSVVWKLNNAPQGANAAVGLAVEADVDLPDDKMKAIVTFEKNSDPSLPASHTIKIRFIVEPGSFSGGIKQISVPQMRPEASPNGEPLAGVTVQIVPNSFLVGLSPGNAEAANTDLMRRLQWVDIPMLLDNGKIAKLTFEKGESGTRDLNEAFEAWQK